MNAKASVSYVYMPCDTVNYLRCIFRRCIHCACSTCLHVYSTLCSPEYFARSNTQIHTHTYILLAMKWYVSGTMLVIVILAKSMKHSKYIARQLGTSLYTICIQSQAQN